MTATIAVDGDDVNGAYAAAACDAYRMAAEALLMRQGLLTTGDEGSHTTVEDAISAQCADRLPRLREGDLRTFH